MGIDEAVLAVCVDWNGGAVLLETVRALAASDYGSLRIVVVDNGSTSVTLPDFAESAIPVEVVRLDENRGYGAALNFILKREVLQAPVPPRYVLAMNNDIRLERETISRLVACARQEGPGIFGPKVLQSDRPDRLEAAWGDLTWSHVLARFHGKNSTDGPRWSSRRKATLLLGSALLVDTTVIPRIGLFDERFFLYHEEVDLLYRASLAGVPAFFCPDARSWHIGGYSSRKEPDRKTYWLRRNAVLFLRKHRASPARWIRFAGTLAASLAFNLLAFRGRRAVVILQGCRDGWNLPLTEETV